MEIDTTLLNAARTMNKDVLMQIFDLYSPHLYNYAMRLCGDRLMADQIVGDVFAKLLDQLSLGQGPTSNLRSYLYQTTYHLIVDEVRHAQRRIPLEEASSLREDKYLTSLSLEDHTLMGTVMHAIQNDLSDDQRHVIVLRFLEECSLLETAVILGKKVNHVKVIQARAIAKLRSLLDSQERKKSITSQNQDMKIIQSSTDLITT